MLIATGGELYKSPRKGVDYWYCRIYCKDSETGKKKDKYISTDLPATKKNIREAQERLNEEIQKRSNICTAMRFDLYCKRWLEKKKPEIEPTTFEGYEYKINYITEYFSGYPISLGELSPQHISDFYSSLLSKEKKVSSKHNTVYLRNRTIKDISVLLNSILNEAVALEIIKRNPASGVKVPKRPEPQKQKPFIDEEDAQAFLDAIKGDPLEALYIIALFYGLRRSEVVGLKWSAVRNGRIHIEHTVVRVRSLVSKDRTKTPESSRAPMITSNIQGLLDTVKCRQDKNRLLYGDSFFEGNYIFTWPNGKPYSPDYVTKHFKKIIKKIPQLDNSLHLHDLRASCISNLFHEGCTLKDVQVFVGHKDIQTTLDIYARTNEKRQLEVANAMERVLFPQQIQEMSVKNR